MKALLLKLHSDDDWDESDAREKVFKDMGEKRFYYQKGQLGSWSATLTEKTKGEASGEAKPGKIPLLDVRAEDASGSTQPVKKEPGWEAFERTCCDFDEQRKAVQKKEQPARDLLAKLQVRAKKDPTLQSTLQEFTSFLAKFSEKLSEARTLSVEAGQLVGSNTLDEDCGKRCEQGCKELQADEVNVLKYLKKVKSLLD